MRILFDTDVTLDLLLDRVPHSQHAAILFSRVERGELEGYLCATTVTTIHDLATKSIGPRKAESSLKKLLSFLKVASVDQEIIGAAIEARGRDFEDRVIASAALAIEARGIITRNVRDYRKSEVPAYSPREFIKMMKARMPGNEKKA